MSIPLQTDVHVIDIGAPGWCWSRLGTTGEGILSYDGPRGRQSLAVPYTVTGRQIAIPLASFNDAGWLAAGNETRLEVSSRPGTQRWVVRATGMAERDPAEPDRLAYSRYVHPANNPGSNSAALSRRLVLVAPRVRGFYETTVTEAGS
ncbi:hypothetical protein [uncultured Friedmanniella sp.]|uniref:hypothetical protein n=1 Tax=uncultured Friedmanniella sp. TaxID=335381 RepID=UPI0035CCA3F5